MSLLLLLSHPPYESVLLGLARNSVEEGKRGGSEVGVVVSQMAAEVVTEEAFVVLAQQQRGTPRQLPAIYNLDKAAVRRAFLGLSGDDVTAADFWQDFHRHAVRRHNVVHRGLRVTAEEAWDSIAAVTALIDHLRRTVFAEAAAAAAENPEA